MFAGSATTVTFDTFGPELVLDAIERYQLVGTGGAPTFLAGILDVLESGHRDLSSLRTFLVGAASVPPELVLRAEAAGIKAFRCYGSSEHPTVTSGTPEDPLETRAYTDGRCLGANEVRIVDDDGRDLPRGSEGEIATRGPELFVGYRDPALNRDCFLPGGWFRTGDLGIFDANGLLTVTDRKKDIIIRGGENISAKEVEDVLARHPAVSEAAVVAMPDPRLGERVCAVVILRGRHLDLAVVAEHFSRAGVARQKTPEHLVVVEELPRTPAGKVQKFQLRARLGPR
jgi:cyclohexanecarboxylate-CoA ligase